ASHKPQARPYTLAVPLPAGTRLGPYEIVGSLGEGGMGEVYKARDTRLDRTVAVKIVRNWGGADHERRERFAREAKLLASLDHPHICPVHDVGREQDVDYLVMPHLSGETLAARLKKGPLPLPFVIEIASQIGDALDRAHRLGIVPRAPQPAKAMCP